MALAQRKIEPRDGPPTEAAMTENPSQTALPRPRREGVWARIRGDIDCVFQRDPAARNRLEVLLTYPGLHAAMVYRIAHRVWQAEWRLAARLLSYMARVWTSIDIHPGADIGRRFFIDHGSGVVIGETAEVGDDVTLYHGVTLGGTSWSKGKRHPTLGDGVVVGAGAKILGPVEIGDHAKVGANSVVIGDVPAKRTVVGIPAKMVRQSKVSGLNPYGVDLNHHLIPDPVAAAIACLVDRIEELETRAGLTRENGGVDTNCRSCDGPSVCRSPDGSIELAEFKPRS